MSDLYSQLGPIIVEENGTDVVLALLPNEDCYLTPQQAIDLAAALVRIAEFVKAKQ